MSGPVGKLSVDATARPAGFGLAPMSPLIAGLTVLLLLLPVVITVAALASAAPLAIPAGILVALYAWVRLRFRHRGSLPLFISRLDRFVWIECREDRPWLITPERPEDFVQVLTTAMENRAGRD